MFRVASTLHDRRRWLDADGSSERRRTSTGALCRHSDGEVEASWLRGWAPPDRLAWAAEQPAAWGSIDRRHDEGLTCDYRPRQSHLLRSAEGGLHAWRWGLICVAVAAPSGPAWLDEPGQ